MKNIHLVALALYAPSYSSQAFTHDDVTMGVQPNVGRLERDPYICFVEPPTDPAPPPAPPKTFTQEEVNAINAKTMSKLEAKMKAESDAALATMRVELEELKAAQENVGKSAKEVAERQAARERATLESKLTETEKARATADEKAAAAAIKLRETNTNYELQAHASKAKVLPEMTKAALLVFRADSAIEYDADGNVTGVDVGAKRFPTIGEAFADWIKENGAGYQAAPAGGAGTRPSNTTGGKKLVDMSDDALIAQADAQRGRTR
jgi:hypothetical protein